MFGKKCSNCAKKIEKDFYFCPYCAFPVKKQEEKDNFGLLGKDDKIGNVPLVGAGSDGLPQKMPIPFDKIFGSLMNQLGKELGSLNNIRQGGNFKIQISTGFPPNPALMKKQKKLAKREHAVHKINIPSEELERRKLLPRKEAESNVRRLSDRVIYEIKLPGVDKKEQVIIAKLDNSLEIKAYSDKICYTKSIPIDADLIQSYLKENILVLELKE
jgi:hypothetical protein